MSGLLILADEDVDGGVIRALRADGYMVRSVREESSGISDEEVLRFAIHLNALLITQDKGYGRHVRRYGMPPKGLVLVRLVGWSSAMRSVAVLDFFKRSAASVAGKFVVLDPSGMRIAKWP